jgi:hypothetical protein
MIGNPTSDRLLDVVRQELQDNVLPRLAGDPVATASLQMIDHVLETLSRRVAHEIAWMSEETDEIGRIGTLAKQVLASGSTTSAIDALAREDSTSLHLADVEARYSRASGVLGLLSEEAEIGSPLATAVEAALDARLRREVEVIGPFQLVGRS